MSAVKRHNSAGNGRPRSSLLARPKTASSAIRSLRTKEVATNTSEGRRPRAVSENKGTMTDGGDQLVAAASWQQNDFFQRNLEFIRGARDTMTSCMPAAGTGTSSVCNRYHSNSAGPMYRSGNMGSSWRHVRQCTGNLGNHICFIDGHVKEQDTQLFPPHGINRNDMTTYSYISPSLSRPRSMQLSFPETRIDVMPRLKRMNTLSNSFNTRAKGGNIYWYEDNKPVKASSKYTMGSVYGPLGLPPVSLPPIHQKP